MWYTVLENLRFQYVRIFQTSHMSHTNRDYDFSLFVFNLELLELQIRE